MRAFAVALGALTLAAFAASIWYAVYSEAAYLGVLLDAGIVNKLTLFLLTGLLVVIGALPGGRGQSRSALLVLMWVALGFGLLAGLSGLANTLNAIQVTGTTNPKVYGPSMAGNLAPLAFGLLAATVAAFKMGPQPRS